MDSHMSDTKSEISIYPPASSSHADVVANKDLFFSSLTAFHKQMGSSLKIPSMGGKDLDLHLLYTEVTGKGGLAEVIRLKAWKDVVNAFDFPPTITNASFVLRKFYCNFLHHYEQVYFFGTKGNLVPPPSALPPPSPVDPKVALVGPSGEVQPRSIGKKSKYIETYVPAEGDPSHLIGQSVTGAIHAKFDYGFLVTVQVGQEKLKGILYHAPKGGKPHPVSILERPGMTAKLAKHKKKRKKSQMFQKDPLAPKAHRSAYNFFFQEWRKKLKEETSDLNDRECTAKIGEKWSNLSEEGRKRYKDMSEEDRIRHSREVLEYTQKSGVENAAVEEEPQTFAVAGAPWNPLVSHDESGSGSSPVQLVDWAESQGHNVQGEEAVQAENSSGKVEELSVEEMESHGMGLQGF